MAITSINSIIAGSVNLPFYKTSTTSEGAGAFHSLWKVANVAGVNPPAYTAGSGYIPTNATVGAIPFTNPGFGESKFTQLAASSSVVGTLIIYDRLWHCSGFTTAAAATLSVTTPDIIDRYIDFTGIEIWGEVYTAPGATGATWTVSYTNQAGTTGRTATYVHPANAETAGQMLPFTLQAGDTGVQAIASFTTSISSGTAGSIGVTLLKRLAEIPLTIANVGCVLDFAGTGMPVVKNNACLAFMVQCSTTTTGIISGMLGYAQG